MVKEFFISDSVKLVGRTQSAPTGFKHVVEYYKNDKLVEKRQTSYYNRTWESYQYESAISNLLEKMVSNRQLSPDEAEFVKVRAKEESMGSFARSQKMMSGLMAMSKLMSNSKEQGNTSRLRLLKAKYGDMLIIPEDWNSLSEDEKERRLDKIEEFMRNG